ncbi:hypothetical protein RND81_12G024300 [Saponaria officinalis]|uniref:Uncharacterized protein n=1 Tax=Saponaria officinalis TaxID=3572 RepID=A0AAW1H6C3_SAPOF
MTQPLFHSYISTLVYVRTRCDWSRLKWVIKVALPIYLSISVFFFFFNKLSNIFRKISGLESAAICVQSEQQPKEHRSYLFEAKGNDHRLDQSSHHPYPLKYCSCFENFGLKSQF